MNKEFIDFLRNARKGRNLFFNKRGRELYLSWLERMIESPPRFNKHEVRVIRRYINRSIGFYLHLTGMCGRIGKIRIRYDGCMENILFLLDFIIYRYGDHIPREYIERIYSKSLNLVRFCPYSQKELIEYEIDTGLLEKIHFYLEYYYFR